MRQLFLENGSLSVKDIGKPALTNDTLLVETYYSFISSGTEAATIAGASSSSMFLGNLPAKITKVVAALKTEGIEGTKALIRAKLRGGTIQQLGYSCAGRVVAVGKNISTIAVGDFVACAGAGIANHAEMVLVPQHLAVKIGDASSLKEASITTIGAIALQGIRRADLQLGETIVVIGLGLLGQLTVQLAVIAGCRVIGIDPVEDRRKMAEQCGAVAVFDPTDTELSKQINFLTSHHGVDCTIITAASKSDTLVQQAMEITRRKGKVVLVGDVGLHLQRDPLYRKEIDFLISCSYGPGRYDVTYEQEGIDYPYAYVRWTENRNMQTIVHLIEQKRLIISPLISQTVNLAHAAQGYETLKAQKGLGVVIDYEVSSSTLPVEKNKIAFAPAKKGNMRVGVIGAGGFAKIKLLPIIAKISNVTINAVVDPQPATALSTARLYAAATVLSDDRELFSKDLVDIVVIASPHANHASQIIEALKNGKAVFAEKPMVTTHEQLAELSDFLDAHPTVPFCVDYNRTYAPFVQIIETHTKQRSTPLMVHYRMNAGFIPQEHWVQREAGAGRIIGEACHIIDLFCYLTNSAPISISVDALQPTQESLGRTDNFVSTLCFADGSVCTLLYTALGNAAAGKERMEIFFDGKTIVMDDYRSLQGYGFPASFNKTAQQQQKGHEQLIEKFFGALKADKAVMPISFDRLKLVAHLSLIMNDLAVQGGGEQIVRIT